LNLLNPKVETVGISNKLVVGWLRGLGETEDIDTSGLLSIGQATLTAYNTCTRTEVSMKKCN